MKKSRHHCVFVIDFLHLPCSAKPRASTTLYAQRFNEVARDLGYFIQRTKRQDTHPFKAIGSERETNKRLEIAKQEDLKAKVAELRAELKENGAVRADYAQLEQFSKELSEKVKSKDITIDELNEDLAFWRNQNKFLAEKASKVVEKIVEVEKIVKVEDTTKIKELEKKLSEALQSKKAPETIKDTPKEEKIDFRASEGHYLRETMTLRREIKQIKEEHSKLKEEHSKLKMAYDSLCQHLQEITGYRVLVKAVEAIKAKFLPTQEAKREEKPKSAFKQLEEDIAQIHKENPDTKKELSDKERLMQIADKIQREKEQNTQSVKTFVEEQKPKPKSSWRDR